MSRTNIRRRACLVFAGAMVGALSVSSAAQASLVTVGQLFPPTFSCSGPFSDLQSGASGNSYVIPSPGLLTSWSFQDGGTVVTGLKLKVGRSAGGNLYTIVAESSAPTQTPNAVSTYPASIPVQAGDIIGIVQNGGTCAASTADPADELRSVIGDAPPNSTMSYSSVTGFRIPVSATLQPQPGIVSIKPAAGPRAGGTKVTITGHDFTGATAVSFGTVSARRFTLNSDTQITAVSPRGPSSGGRVDLSVTTAAGQSASAAADGFTFGCVVPKLKRKNLERAKKALRKADCRLGKVKPKGQETGRVKKQKPKTGKVLPAGGKVNVKLG